MNWSINWREVFRITSGVATMAGVAGVAIAPIAALFPWLGPVGILLGLTASAAKNIAGYLDNQGLSNQGPK